MRLAAASLLALLFLTGSGCMPGADGISERTVLGYLDARFGNSQIFPNEIHLYFSTATPQSNRAYLGGTWTVEKERAVLGEAGGTIVYRFRAAQVNLVMGAPAPIRMRVRLNGTLIAEDIIRDKDLYTLLTQTDYEEGVVEIEFLDPGVEVYAFTFS